MSEYSPDCWVVVEITDKETKVFRILASWYGGFAGPNSWKLGSTIERVIKHEHFFEFENSSGSTYYCQPGVYKMSMLSASIYDGFCADVAKFGGTIRILDLNEIETLNEILKTAAGVVKR